MYIIHSMYVLLFLIIITQYVKSVRIRSYSGPKTETYGPE